MKQCDRGLSPFAPPLAIDSSSLSFAASESDPEDSVFRDFTFDFSFLTSDDQKICLDDDEDVVDSLSYLSRRANSNSVPKAEESELYGLAANARPVKDQSFDLEIRKGENLDSFLKLPIFLEPSPSLAVVSTSRFDSNVTICDERSQHIPPSASVLGVTSITPAAKNGAIAKDREACLSKFLVEEDINENNFSPLFTKMSALRINSNGSVLSEKSSMITDLDDTEVDSPCWKGTRSHRTAASGTKSLSFRRSTDDLNVIYGLNPLAPQFIPSNAKKNLDKIVKEFEENGSSSLKRSLSSSFPLSSGDFSMADPSEAKTEQDSSQKNCIGTLFQDADESLGLVSQNSVSKAMSILDISNQFQTPKKLDPLAPVFVPANAKPSAVVYEKSGVADHMIATEKSDHSAYASSEVGHIARDPYSNNVHESGKTYSFNPRLKSQVQISENTKLDSSSNKTHGSKKKLNPLAPQFSLVDTNPKVYGSEKNQAANDLPLKVNSSALFSPVGYRNHKELHASFAQSAVHGEPSFNEVDTNQIGGQSPYILHGNSSSQMDVKKLLTTIHGLSELLAHVHSSETSDSPNEQDLDLINCTVQNLNSYVNNRIQEHTGNYASDVQSSCYLTSLPNMSQQSISHQIPKARNLSANVDVRRKEKYSLVSAGTGADSQFEYGVAKENGFGQVVRNHQTEEQFNPQVFFYKSLWLKEKADRSLMEYETFISKTRT